MILECIKRLLLKETQIPEIFEAIKNYFGVLDHTKSTFRKVGFILPDGSWIDLSDGQYVRTLPHRTVVNAILEIDDSLNVDDILNMGAIRCDGSLAILDVTKQPTSIQLQSVREFLQLLTTNKLELTYFNHYDSIRNPSANVDVIIDKIKHARSFSMTRDFLNTESLNFDENKDEIIQLIVDTARSKNKIVPIGNDVMQLKWITPDGEWIIGYNHMELIDNLPSGNPFANEKSMEKIKDIVISLGFIRLDCTTAIIDSLVEVSSKALQSLKVFIEKCRTREFDVEKHYNNKKYMQTMNKFEDEIIEFIVTKF